MRWLLQLARSVAGVATIEFEDRWREGFSVRLAWPDGMHDLVAFRWTRSAAERSMRGIDNVWRLGPIRPCCSGVPISYRDWDLHRRRHDGRSPECATTAHPTTDPEWAAR